MEGPSQSLSNRYQLRSNLIQTILHAMPQPKALIFDVDGTLADTERDGHRVAFNRAFEEAGLDWHWDIETRHFVELLKSGTIPLRPGVRRLLLEARAAGLRLATATTTTPQNVTTLLISTLGEESISWFDVIAAGDVVAEKKPAPDIFLYAMKKMGLNANDCVAFEDSENGLRSSIGAGIKTIVTTNAYTHQQDFTGAALVLDQLGEPQAAFSVLSGNAGTATYVDVKLIKNL